MIKIQRLNQDASLYLEIGGWKLLIDPWLEGTEVDFFGWFNTQWHRTAPLNYEEVPDFDTVLITQKYPDHFHLETLKKLAPNHIIAPQSLARKIRKHLPGATLTSMDAEQDQVVFKQVQVTFLPTRRKLDPIYDAFILDDGEQSVFLATHGYKIGESSSAQVRKASPCQLLITPFNLYKLPVVLGGIVSPGLDGVKHLCEALQPVRVLAVHDEDKHAKGMVSRFAKITRPGSTFEIKKLPYLANRYLDLNDYKPHLIS